MPRSSSRDDNTTDDGASVDNTYDDDATPPGGGRSSDIIGRGRGIPVLGKLFASCEVDPLGSVHRAWAVTVLLMALFFVVSVMEGECFVYRSMMCSRRRDRDFLFLFAAPTLENTHRRRTDPFTLTLSLRY